MKTTTKDTLPVTYKPHPAITRGELPSGPSISGTVTVPLAELDKMRQDHANLKAISEELVSKQMQVRVTLEERRTEGRYDTRGYGEPRWINDARYAELSTSYRGLDEITEIIRKEEREKLLTVYNALKTENETLTQATEDTNKRILEATKTSKEEAEKLRDELDSRKRDFDKLDTIQTVNNSYKNQIEKLGIKLRNTEDKLSTANQKILELKEERYKKTWWYKLWY